MHEDKTIKRSSVISVLNFKQQLCYGCKLFAIGE